MLASVIMPTHVRREWLIEAIDCYLAQDWDEKELVVLDSGNCRDLFDRVPKDELVYRAIDDPVNPETRKTDINLSVKRNFLVGMARGEYIVHFDSDDWSAPGRVRHQVEALAASGKQSGGYHSAMFWDDIHLRASLYTHPGNYAWGPTFCYRREWALAHPWDESVAVAEDANFLAEAEKVGESSTIDGTGMMVVRLHSANDTVFRRNRFMNTTQWPQIPTKELPEGFLRLIHRYYEAREAVQ